MLDDESLYLSSEGANAPLLRVDLPDEIRDAMAASDEAEPSASGRVRADVQRDRVADGEQRPTDRGAAAGGRSPT